MSAVSIRRVRRAAQLATVLAFIAIPALNARELSFFTGNMLAFSAGGVPLADPLAMLQVAVASFSATPSMIAGAGLSLALAAVMGPIFCSWICPFGFLSELVHRNGGERTGGNGSVSGRPFLAKAALVCAGLLFILAAQPAPVLSQLSMPGWFTRFWQHAIIHRAMLLPAAVGIPALLLLESAARKRLWCRYVCPQSVLISLAGLALAKRFLVRFNKRACTCQGSDQVCRKTCSLGLNPREAGLAQKALCTNCGDCIDACAARGCALSFGFGPGSGASPEDAQDRR